MILFHYNIYMIDKNKHNFITWYNNVFYKDELYLEMQKTKEDSPWHREDNVAIHTNMVVNYFVSNVSNEGDWDRDDVARAMACVFHDVGKPNSKTEQYSESRGTYYRFAGHESLSARLWEDYAVRNWKELQELFNFTPYHIYKIGWIIEHHKPWDIKKPDKLKKLAHTVSEITWCDAFGEVLMADALGRIVDDHQANIDKANQWLDNFHRVLETIPFSDTLIDIKKPNVTLLIGATGSGKSTWVTDNLTSESHMYSWDDLRLTWYDSNYAEAFKLSIEDKNFNKKVNTEYMKLLVTKQNIVVDNTNLGHKRRRFFIDEAHKKGYNTTAILFPAALNVIRGRQHSRTDKIVPDNVVSNQYFSIQYPHYGDFDEIIVSDTNLPS